MVPMVGLGGSAGGIAALQGFFASAPADSGMAFVVVMHLSAEHESMLPQIIQRSTPMPVTQVAESAEVEPDHVYVIPPGKALESANGHLTCTDLTPDRGRRVAVDLFFRTLADTHGPRAAAIVLSGADGDGAIGIKRVKERGGLTIAQDPDEAEHSSMPRSAIATGLVDWILPVADMPARLVSYTSVLERIKLPPEDGPLLAPTRPAPDDSLEATLREILAYLRTHTGRDFSYYKRATILRRLARRMSVTGIEELPGYLAFLRTHPAEAGALLKDLLISVTNFFRDRDAFDALEEQVPLLFAGKSSSDEIRVWVPACASGEEAYSIAILLIEHARLLDSPPSLQIFATDLDDDAIRAGRDGVYPPAIAADVSEERLRRFFTRESRGFRIRAEIREAVVFASHDLLKDAPFSRVDLVSCRNLFIYLSREAQQRALEIVHFALRPHGRLFLGVSETIDAGGHLFRVVDKKHRIYEPRLVRERRLPRLVGRSDAGALARPQGARRQRNGPIVVPPRGGFFPLRPSPEALGVSSWREVHLKLIERLAPASIVVTGDFEMVHLSERAGRYLRHSAGEPTNNVLLAIDPLLTADLRTALLRAQENEESVQTAPIPFGERRRARRRRRPRRRAEDLAPGFLLITLLSRRRRRRSAPPAVRRRRRRPGAGAPPAAAGRRAEVAPARRHRAGNGDGAGAEGEQRRAAGDERGAALGDRGARDQPRGAAVDQRGAHHRQPGAQGQGRRAEPEQRRPAEPDGGDGDRHRLPRPRPVHLALHAVGGRALQPDRCRRRPADQRPRQPARVPGAQRRRARRARLARADRARGPLRRPLAARPPARRTAAARTASAASS